MATEKMNPPVPEEQVSAAEDTNTISLPQKAVAEETTDVPPKTVKSRAKKSETSKSGEGESEPAPEKPKRKSPVKKTADTAVTEVSAAEEGTVTVSEKELKADVAEGESNLAPAAEDTQTGESAEKKVEPGTDAVADDDEAEEKVDFSEEEAQLDELAAEAPEFDLGEESELEIEHKVAGKMEGFDLSGKSKDELLNIFAELLAEKPVQGIRREVEAIKVAFYKIRRVEVDELRRKFVEGGGDPEGFTPPADSAEQRLKDLFGEYRKRRDEFIANLERSKEDNFQIKLKIIEDLKELVGSSETLGNTFHAFRDLQQRWKDVGPVPQANVKDLWETYNHHVENFYSFIKINKELRDLDLKRNYEAKITLCEEAEELILDPSVVSAFHRLQKLHEQWREIGPVANEYKESLWDRFREASSRVNKQHQEYFEGLKDEQKRNLDLKSELCVKTEELADGVWTTRKEWNKASEKLLEVQKIWKTIGFAPKKDNAKVYERFRNACDRFFEQKRNFYLQLKAEMEHNLVLKNEICQQAEALTDSEEWKRTTDELIGLQKRWKEIGPVPRRHSDTVWKRFRAACDRFFERKSGHFSVKDSEYSDNLARKRELLTEIDAADIIGGGFDIIKEFQRRWSEIGFVPIKQKDAIQREYKEAMDKAFAVLRGSGQSRSADRSREKVQNTRGGGDKRDRLYTKVKQLESEIALLENNIGFFSNSKNAEAMIRDVNDKIDRLKAEMAAAIEKINLIDKQE